MSTVNIKQIDGPVPVSALGGTFTASGTVGVSGTVAVSSASPLPVAVSAAITLPVSGTEISTIATNTTFPGIWSVLPNIVSISAAAATPLTASSTSGTIKQYITLQPVPSNTAVVYVGTSAATSSASWAVALSAGDPAIRLDGIREAAHVYCYATVSGQSVAWSGV